MKSWTRVHEVQSRKVLLMGVLALLFLLSSLAGCSKEGSKLNEGPKPKEEYNQKESLVETVIHTEKENRVGDRVKMGWELQVPPGTFQDGTNLSMKVMSKEEAAAYESAGFALYTAPVELKANGQENVRLAEQAPMTVQIPEGLLKDMIAEELFFGTYYDGQWEYVLPDNINLDEGTATFKSYHFSVWGFGKPTEAEQISIYAQNYAALQWEQEQRKQKLTDALGRRYNDLLASLGVSSNAARNQYTADLISYLEEATLETGGVAPIDALAQMANAASKGPEGMQEFQNKLLEYTGKGLTACLEELHNVDEAGEYTKKFGSSINILGNLSSAMGYISEGDKVGALESIGSMLKGADPVGALIISTMDFVKESMESTIDYFTQSELEKAYQIYIGAATNKYGYGTELEGDIDTIFTLMGGGQRQTDIRIVKKYCEKYGIDESSLSQVERDKITGDALRALKNNFERRKVSEEAISKIKQKEEAFIAALKAQGLLSPTSYKKSFGIDEKSSNFNINDRIAKLYHLRSLVLRYVDPDKVATLSNDQIAKLIDQWIFWTEKKDRVSFFKYLREMGYNQEPLQMDSNFAWVLVETRNQEDKASVDNINKGGVYQISATASPGSYTYSSKYIGETDTYPDPDQKNGEGYAMKLDISVPPAVIQGGETVTLSFNLAFTQQNISYFDGNGGCRADFDSSRFVNKDGKNFFEIYCSVKYKEKNNLSVSDIITAEAPRGNAEGDRIELWTGGPTGGIGTTYIYEWKMQ